MIVHYFFFQAEDGIRDLVRSRGLGDVYKRQLLGKTGWAEKAGAFKNPESAPDLGEVVPRGRGVFLSLIHI